MIRGAGRMVYSHSWGRKRVLIHIRQNDFHPCWNEPGLYPAKTQGASAFLVLIVSRKWYSKIGQGCSEASWQLWLKMNALSQAECLQPGKGAQLTEPRRRSSGGLWWGMQACVWACRLVLLIKRHPGYWEGRSRWLKNLSSTLERTGYARYGLRRKETWVGYRCSALSMCYT